MKTTNCKKKLCTAFCIFLLTVICFKTYAQTDSIYIDTPATNWLEGSWGGNTSNINCTTNPYKGSKCIEVQYTDWGSFGFDHRSEGWDRFYYYPNQYKYVSFWFNPGDDIDKLANLRVTLDASGTANIQDYLPATITKNTWYKVRIPLSKMDEDNEAFFRLFFTNASGSVLPHIYIDNICFEYIEDGTAPVISDVATSDIEQDIATVSWKTDEPVKYTFEYRLQGTTGSYTKITSADYSAIGKVDLTGLTFNKTYEYKFTCSDHQRNSGTPANSSSFSGTFTTKTADDAGPVISNLRVIDVYDNRVVIGWDTDEPSTTVLKYGVGNYNTTYSDTLYTRLHTVVLTHIAEGTQFQYKVSSKDKQNNTSEKVTNPAMTFTTKAKAAKTGKYIIADHPLYQWDEVGPTQVPWRMITHLNLGQLWPQTSDSSYTLDMGDYTWWGNLAKWKTEAKKYITNGHNAHRKIICMLGGADSNPDGRWNAATSAANVAAFALNIVKTLKPMGFDGVSLDWESNSDYDLDFPSMIRLVKEIRKDWPDAHIDVPAGMNGDDAKDLTGAIDYATTFSPMSYYAVPQWGGWLLPVPLSPLYTVGDNEYGTDATLKKYKDAGFPDEKVLIGVGGFGEIWGDSNKDGLAPVRPYVSDGDPNGESAPMGSDNLVTWSFVKQLIRDNPTKLIESWDNAGQAAYWHTADSSKQIKVLYPGRTYYLDVSLVFFETARSMSKKVEYIEKVGTKGIGSWTLSQLIDNGYSPVLDAASCMLLDTLTSATVPATGVTVDPTTASLAAGTTIQLTATVAPANATNKTVTWSTSNASVATVSASGLVTAVAAGTATITVTTLDGSKKATTAITVTAASVAVTGVTADPATVALTAGATKQLTATVAPANATNKNVTWSTGNASVATVSATGLVTAVAAGTATITVTTADGSKKANVSVTVNGTTGISENKQDKPGIFPNPLKLTESQVYLTGISQGILIIKVADIRGRIVFQKTMKVSESTVGVNLHNMKAGLYFITIHNNGETVNEKLVVQ